MIGRARIIREVIVSSSKLEALAFDNPDATITLTGTSAYLSLGGVVYVAALGTAVAS